MAKTIKLNSIQLAAFMYARTLDATDPATAKAVRKDTWADVRNLFGIPESIKLKVELDNRTSPDYLVLKDKSNDGVLMADDELGDYSHTVQAGSATPATSPASPVPTANGVRYYRIAIESLVDYLEDSYEAEQVSRPEDFKIALDGDHLLVRAD